jgi:hypothetical protein
MAGSQLSGADMILRFALCLGGRVAGKSVKASFFS